MKQVAEYFGVTKQAMCHRLKVAGVQARPAGCPIDREITAKAVLEELYVSERLTVNQIAERLDSTQAKILYDMDHHGIERRRPPSWVTKYPQLRALKVGESVDLPRKTNWPKPAVQYYVMAKQIGIRVSTRTIDPTTMRVTRIE